MADVDLIWSTTNGGASITAAVDHGDKGNGETSSEQEIFVRHTGVNSITGCKIYIRAVQDGYNGDTTALDDFAEIISWGDATTANSFGGFMINMNAVAGYPDWPSVSVKSTANSFCCRTGVADSSTNGVTITTATGASASGVIQAGTSPNVRFQCRTTIPIDEATLGIRQWEHVLLYSYTS